MYKQKKIISLLEETPGDYLCDFEIGKTFFRLDTESNNNNKKGKLLYSIKFENSVYQVKK